MLHLLYFTERGGVRAIWGWQRGLAGYTDYISRSKGLMRSTPQGENSGSFIYFAVWWKKGLFLSTSWCHCFEKSCL